MTLVPAKSEPLITSHHTTSWHVFRFACTGHRANALQTSGYTPTHSVALPPLYRKSSGETWSCLSQAYAAKTWTVLRSKLGSCSESKLVATAFYRHGVSSSDIPRFQFLLVLRRREVGWGWSGSNLDSTLEGLNDFWESLGSACLCHSCIYFLFLFICLLIYFCLRRGDLLQ